ncbi:MAG: hypothetical protein FJ164_06350 [Gammaproteobacteria bacterium]|nr:hypothetical protein [Gammaproteobacteria bacterium]
MMEQGAGGPDTALSLADAEAVRETSLALVRRARRSVDIFSRHLDPMIYDTAEFVEGLRALIVGSRRARVRVLLREVAPVVAQGHRLIELAQRLSSYIEIRVPALEHQDTADAWLVVDGCHYLHRRSGERHEATAAFDDARRARQLTLRFEEIWARAQPDLNFKRLHL